jgi:hypothetical protein
MVSSTDPMTMVADEFHRSVRQADASEQFTSNRPLPFQADRSVFFRPSQWTGERFLKENKTELADEFREFENEIELRKRGAER